MRGQRQLLLAGALVRQHDGRLAKSLMYGTLVGDVDPVFHAILFSRLSL